MKVTPLLHARASPLRDRSKCQSCVDLSGAPAGRARQLAEIGRGDARRRIAVVHVIERVESVASELQCNGFCDPETLPKRNICRPSAEPTYERRVSRTGSKRCTGHWGNRDQSESGFVQVEQRVVPIR